MANRESNLDLISVNQAQKEVTANELFNAASPAMLYGRRASLSTGLTFGYYGGNIVTSSGSVVAVENGTVELTAESTNYIVARKSDGEVSASTSDTDWNSSDYWRLYLCETGPATVTDYTDYRIIGEMTSVAGGGGSTPPGGAAGQALVKNSSSDGDVKWSYAIGENALSSLTTGIRNTAMGKDALSAVTTGNRNTAFGFEALKVNNGASNAAFGANTLPSNTSGSFNSAFGTALFKNTTGSYNCAFGYGSINENTIGSHNCAFGYGSMNDNTTGSYNSAFGRDSLSNATTGNRNTSIGYNSLVSVTTGSNNIGIADINDGTLTPVFNVTTEDNRAVFGHTSITNAYIQVPWTVVSDKRDKSEIQELNLGLEFVEKLKPVSFKFRTSRDSETTHGNTRYGFLAQDILELEGDNPVIIDNEDEDKLKYNGESLVPVLVKAIQEQMVIIRQLQEDIALLKGQQ